MKVSLTTQNTEQIESALKNNEIDLGIIEGQTKDSSIKYSEFIKDEIVLIASNKNPFFNKGIIQQKELLTVPLLLREPGSGTLEVVAHSYFIAYNNKSTRHFF